MIFFLDWCSRLPSTSTRCFCSCNSSSFHFWTRTFFFRTNMPWICDCVNSTSTTFLLWFRILIFFIPLPFLCFAQARKKIVTSFENRKCSEKFFLNGLKSKIRENYSRFRQNGHHFVLTSQTTRLWRETSGDGYRRCASKYFPLPVVDIRRRRILRSLLTRYGGYLTLNNFNLTSSQINSNWFQTDLFTGSSTLAMFMLGLCCTLKYQAIKKNILNEEMVIGHPSTSV